VLPVGLVWARDLFPDQIDLALHVLGRAGRDDEHVAARLSMLSRVAETARRLAPTEKAVSTAETTVCPATRRTCSRPAADHGYS
jgi:hypothetical protein